MNCFPSMKKITDLQTLINESLNESSEVGSLARVFLEDQCIPKYAFGRNDDVLAIHKIRPLNGIVDDYFPDNNWKGIPVIRSHQLSTGAIVINGSTSIAPVNIENHLHRLPHVDQIRLYQVVAASKGALKSPWFVIQQRKEITEHLDAWWEIYTQLADEISKQTLLDTLRFRLTANPKYMLSYHVRINEQYFEPFMNYSQEIFVDAGGYDGDTTEAFVRCSPDYRKVYFFEPSQKNMLEARKRLEGIRDVEFRNVGLSDAVGKLCFDPELGSASSVQSIGKDHILVETLDHAVKEPVTFIKMDLEGWEMQALLGAHSHISQDRPKLALAVYHHGADFRRIYEYIKGFNHDYKIYLRHYTQGWSETVMYFC